jgi:hypothetical protein
MIENKKHDYKIYALAQKGTKNFRYVGVTRQTLDKRLTQHRSDKRKYPKCDWVQSLNKNIDIFLIHSGCYTENEAYIVEMEYVSKFKNEGYDLLNACEGGKYPKMTPQIRSKLSDSLKESYRTGKIKPIYGRNPFKGWSEHKMDAYKKNMSKVCTGRKHTEESKRKISKINKGKTHSKKVRHKMSLAKKGKPNLKARGLPVSQKSRERISKTKIERGSHAGGKNHKAHNIYSVNIKDKTFKNYECIKYATDELKINKKYILSCCRGDLGHYKGYTFLFSEDFNKKDIDLITSNSIEKGTTKKELIKSVILVCYTCVLEFDSIKDCADFLEAPYSSVAKIANGKTNHLYKKTYCIYGN